MLLPTAQLTQSITDFFKSKWFWYAVLVAIIYYVIRRNWYNLMQWSAPTYVEATKDSKGNTIKITPERQKALRQIANNLYITIYDWKGLDRYPALAAAQACTDAELKYVARYYADVLNKTNKGTSLYVDLNNEFLPFTDLDNKILLRLAQMGLL